MSLELTNLLPPERLRALRGLYFLRLATVAAVLLSGVALVHGVLLFPSYLYLHQQTREREASLAALSARLAGSEEQEVSARVAALTQDATHLARLASTPTASAAISAVLEIPRSGIRLTGFTFAPVKDQAVAMTVSGVASSRESLRAYESALAAEPYVSSANLPISAYAKEAEIPFTISLTGTFMP